MTLLYLSIAWLAGIVLTAYESGAVSGTVEIEPWVIYSSTLSISLIAALLWRDDAQKRRAAWCAVFALLGAWRYTAHLPDYHSPKFSGYHCNREVFLEGVIVQPPEDRDKQTVLYVKPRRLGIGDETYDINRGLVRVQTSLYQGYKYGDAVQISGALDAPPEFVDFSYREYLARRDVYAMMYYPQIEKMSDSPSSIWYLPRKLSQLRERLNDIIARQLPEPHAALLSGILLGIESKIPAALWETFNITGISHIIVISGYNFVIITGVIIAITRRWLSHQRATIVALVMVWLYALLVGGAAPVMRAALVASLSLIALRFGRQTEAYTSLGFAALLMSLHNPQVLWDVSFQLTFAATLSLIQFATPAQRRFENWLLAIVPAETPLRGITATLNESLVVTLAAQVLTLPVLLYHFGTMSVYFPLTNALVLPVQPLVMGFGSAAAIIGSFSHALGRFIAMGAWLPLAYTVAVAEFIAELPQPVISIGHVPLWMVTAYYAVLEGALWWRKLDEDERVSWRERLTAQWLTKSAIIVLVSAVLLIWVAVGQQSDGKLHVFFLDVEQGDAIFIVGPRGQQILVDGGPSPSRLLTELGKRMPFWDRSLDLVVLTHPDDDHVSGLVPVLERYRVEQVLDTEIPKDTAPSREWEKVLSARDIPVTIARRGMQLDLDSGAFAEVLNPPAKLMTGTRSDDNNNSIVLRLRYGHASFLLTGDAEEETERAILHSGHYLPSLVLKVGHHGSKFSTSATFVEEVMPHIAVIQVGADNRFGHPAPEVLDNLQGINILRTDELGTIEVVTDGYRYEVRKAR